jgi:hypothetical protein
MAIVSSGPKLRVPVQNPTEDATHVEVDVYYQKAGPNYWTGGRDEGGIYVSAQPITVRPDGGVCTVLGSGLKHLLRSSDRLNRKRLADVADGVRTQVETRTGVAWQLVLHVCAKNGVAV